MQIKENTRFNIAVDICSALSIILFIVLSILIVHYHPNDSGVDSDGNLTFPLVLAIANILPGVFAIVWLMLRYNYVLEAIGKKYPFTQTWLFRLFYMFILPIIIVILLRS